MGGGMQLKKVLLLLLHSEKYKKMINKGLPVQKNLL